MKTIAFRRGWYWVRLREHQALEPAFFTGGNAPVFHSRFGVHQCEELYDVHSELAPPEGQGHEAAG